MDPMLIIFGVINIAIVLYFYFKKKSKPAPGDFTQPRQPSISSLNVDNEINQLIRSGKMIEAIKLIRESKGIGLKEAKDCAEELQERLK